jgi:hypothetical protein
VCDMSTHPTTALDASVIPEVMGGVQKSTRRQEEGVRGNNQELERYHPKP